MGNVGSEVYRHLIKNKRVIEQNTNSTYQIKYISAKKIEKVDLYPDHLHELVCVLLKSKKIKKGEYLVTDESIVSHFIDKKEDLKILSKLEKKYNLKKIKLKDHLCDIVEKMHSFMPF